MSTRTGRLSYQVKDRPVSEMAASETMEWAWPFSLADLTAGLRRYYEDTSLRLVDVQSISVSQRRPAVGKIRGVLASFEGRSGHNEVRLVVKEPQGTTRLGLAGAGRREVGFYKSLSSEVPLRTPDLIAADPAGDWLVLEHLDMRRLPAKWEAEDYLHAVDALADLHDRFWNLAEDLEVFAWLSEPLEADFDVHVAAADKAIEKIVEAAGPEPLAGFPGRRWILERLAEEADRVVVPLRAQPATLLHGDYWPGNIAIGPDGAHSVIDWQLTGIGPGIMDLLVFVNKSDWWFGPLPLARDELIDRYRGQLGDRGVGLWSEAQWSRLWDHALMWRFVQEWLDLLAAVPLPVLATRAEQLNRVWLQPVEEALDRRLGEGA